MLWRGALALEDGMPANYQVCATDRAGNEGCASVGGGPDDAGVGGDDFGTHPGDDHGGCCSATRDARGSIALALVTLAGMLRRRRASRRSNR
jgi:hypothetical protein